MAVPFYYFRDYLADPKRRSMLGYKTGSSLKNDETWRYAQLLCAKVFLKVGIALFVAGLLLYLLVLNGILLFIVAVGLIALFYIVGAIYLIYKVEKGLKDKFGD